MSDCWLRLLNLSCQFSSVANKAQKKVAIAGNTIPRLLIKHLKIKLRFLLLLLPVPRRQQSHIALDLATSIPPSTGNTAILTIIEWLSKAFHFVVLHKLPTALETAKLLTQRAFRLLAFLRTLSPNVGPSSRHKFGRSSVLGRERKWVYLRSFTFRRIVGQSGPTKNWAVLRCCASSNQTTWRDQLALVEYIIQHPLGSRHSKHPGGSNLLWGNRFPNSG